MQIKLGKIETAEWYIDKAFARAKKKINMVKIGDRAKTQGEKYRHLEAVRLNVIRDALTNDLQGIRHAFPRYDDLGEFYQEMFGCFVDFNIYKKSLAALMWGENKISHIFKIQNSKLKDKETTKDVMTVRNVFMARTNSIMKQISSSLEFLDDARKKLKDMPNFKPNMYTVAIAGFPNVGKSTLLGKMTDSDPEINSYAFTTKGLMIGYLIEEAKKLSPKEAKEAKEAAEVTGKKKRKNNRKVQMVDTPGTLNREKKMNKIEKMAGLVLNHLSDKVVYVFDLTEISYPVEDQVKLYHQLVKKGKDIIVFFSKSDILDTKIIDKFEIDNEIAGYYDVQKVRKEIMKDYVDKKDIETVVSNESNNMK